MFIKYKLKLVDARVIIKDVHFIFKANQLPTVHHNCDQDYCDQDIDKEANQRNARFHKLNFSGKLPKNRDICFCDEKSWREDEEEIFE